jgi:UDP-2,3-diacylglucosamine pyrophosphatase LpxH
MPEAVILSDIHLGSDNCQARRLVRFLETLEDPDRRPAKLILNGDVFDSIDFRRLNKHHWKVLSLLRKLSDRMEIIWLCGNHDGSAEEVSHLLGVTVMDEYVLVSGGRRLLVLHGHAFDEFIDNHPVLTWLGDVIYYWLQRIDRTHAWAKRAKTGSKTFLRCAQKIHDKSIEHARKQKCQAVCCGHTHHPAVDQTQEVAYYNSGCWTEEPGTYLAVDQGRVTLHFFDDTPAPQAEAARDEQPVLA